MEIGVAGGIGVSAGAERQAERDGPNHRHDLLKPLTILIFCLCLLRVVRLRLTHAGREGEEPARHESDPSHRSTTYRLAMRLLL